ncbi:S-type pyocin domain-containing protein [Enterobacteriaceae bacterium YMB-R22]|uniref:S-type pyocin domain-containing protein n=1 Tax=Tenebrionicola larvae TaxID=2815733 RepID=UPI0020111F73|nr:S-type pyocin domain-containing protein [Tenebrionicola larvae]MBV4412636.1 S-type pyocin domain-containing protein [Tenebrionicola larvae]
MQFGYTFTTEEDPPITIVWTPDNTGENNSWNTGNQNPVRIPNPVVVDPLAEDTSIEATTTPAPAEKKFADYILILPLPNIPPIYIYLSKPPVKFLEVDLYSNLEGRSREGKYHADHIPSKAAVKEYYRNLDPLLDKDDINDLANEVAAITVPIDVHRKISETYGRRNSEAQIKLDASNLRAAVDRNLDAIKSALKEHGATEAQIEAARVKMHKINSSMGLYK